MDTGTGILDLATEELLRMADQIVVCAAPGIDASRASSLTLDWLDEHGYHDLVTDAVVVINQVRKNRGRELRSVSEHFAKRCRAVVNVPWDPTSPRASRWMSTICVRRRASPTSTWPAPWRGASPSPPTAASTPGRNPHSGCTRLRGRWRTASSPRLTTSTLSRPWPPIRGP